MRRISLSLIAAIAVLGSVERAAAQVMPMVGQTMTVGFNFCPMGWLVMDGSLLSITEHEVLFTLIGTAYGGDGQDTFALPIAPAEPLADGGLLRYCIAEFGVIPQH